MIDAAKLRQLLDYDPESGAFTWKTRGRELFTRPAQWVNWNARYPGTEAGAIRAKGYRAIAILDRFYQAHRLAWLYVHGKWPQDQIDHINGDPDDNRIANLREASGSVNARNKRLQRRSATGRVGVNTYPYQGRMKYAARIRVDGHLHHLGYFDTIEAASVARAEAEARFGFHENHGTKAKAQKRAYP